MYVFSRQYIKTSIKAFMKSTSGSKSFLLLFLSRNIIEEVDEQMLVFDPKEDNDEFFFHGRKQERRDLNKKVQRDQKFAFDCVYGPNSTNSDVFEGTTKDLIAVLFSGFNCSVFVYGATGSGKTHTMLGKENNPGITLRTVVELYKHIETVRIASFE